MNLPTLPTVLPPRDTTDTPTTARELLPTQQQQRLPAPHPTPLPLDISDSSLYEENDHSRTREYPSSMFTLPRRNKHSTETLPGDANEKHDEDATRYMKTTTKLLLSFTTTARTRTI